MDVWRGKRTLWEIPHTVPRAVVYIYPIYNLRTSWCLHATNYLFNVKSTMYTVQCTLHDDVHCTSRTVMGYIINNRDAGVHQVFITCGDVIILYCVHCIHCIQCTMYAVQCTAYTVHRTLNGVLCIVCIVRCTVNAVHRALHDLQYAMYGVRCTVFSVQCTLYSVHCTMYIV